jgi:hypothetical protein
MMKFLIGAGLWLMGAAFGAHYVEQQIGTQLCSSKGYREYQILRDYSVRCFNVEKVE